MLLTRRDFISEVIRKNCMTAPAKIITLQKKVKGTVEISIAYESANFNVRFQD